MKRFPGLFFSLVFMVLTAWGQRTDLSGLKFCIDPGHGGNNPANDRYVVPDPGTEFWESESNFQKAMRLDTLLKAQGAWVILTRYTNSYPADDEPSLSARWQLANANNVNWFHSIHTNAFNGTVELYTSAREGRHPHAPACVAAGGDDVQHHRSGDSGEAAQHPAFDVHLSGLHVLWWSSQRLQSRRPERSGDAGGTLGRVIPRLLS